MYKRQTYDDLSESDRERYDDDWEEAYGTNAPEFTPSSQLNSWVFNEKTVDTVLQDLMENGKMCIRDSLRSEYEETMSESDWAAFSGERGGRQQFSGFEMDQTMLRISAMNMMLHSVDMPDIRYLDSISKHNTIRNKYDLILANPPFTGSVDAEDIDPSLKAICDSKQTELLFVALFLRMMKIGGRCACIVPNGVLFRSNSKAYTQLRRELIENQKLEAIIYMPSGVFKPYSGVSTAILVFTKTNAGGTDNVWLYNIEHDGFTLDDKRDRCV